MMSRERTASEDEAGVGPDPRQARHLLPLHELRRFRIVKGEPDIRGWTVYTSNGRDVGTVDELLVDPTIGEVVLLDIGVKGTDRRTAAPVRAAWIDRDHKRVILDGAQLNIEDDLPSLGRTTPPEGERHLELHREPAAAGEPRTPTREIVIVPPTSPASLASTGERTAQRAANDAAMRTSLAPGSEIVIERRVVAADEPAWGITGTPVEPPHDAGLPAPASTPHPGRTLVEEVVVRRRYIDTNAIEPQS